MAFPSLLIRYTPRLLLVNISRLRRVLRRDWDRPRRNGTSFLLLMIIPDKRTYTHSVILTSFVVDSTNLKKNAPAVLARSLALLRYAVSCRCYAFASSLRFCSERSSSRVMKPCLILPARYPNILFSTNSISCSFIRQPSSSSFFLAAPLNKKPCPLPSYVFPGFQTHFTTSRYVMSLPHDKPHSCSFFLSLHSSLSSFSCTTPSS